MAKPGHDNQAERPYHQNAPHAYPTRHGGSGHAMSPPPTAFSPSSLNSGVMNAQSNLMDLRHKFPTDQAPKKVAFELLLDEESKTRARIPLRVLINAHDTTESIVTTVKNFYGIYDNRGVDFQDSRGNSLIANYCNMVNDMTVYVHVVDQPPYPGPAYASPPHNDLSRDNYYLNPVQDQSYTAPPKPAQVLEYGQVPSRPDSVQDQIRGNSPQYGPGRRSASIQKAGSRTDGLSRTSSIQGNALEDGPGSFSDSDGGDTSVTSSKKARNEQSVNSEISLTNIVPDGRRKRPKFESSELPLFVPPQVPLAASSSSISPQRRSTGQEAPSPFARPMQRTFAYPMQPLYSPQSSGYHDQTQTYQQPYNINMPTPAPQHGHRLRERPSVQSFVSSSSLRGGAGASGILPTPDPTIASCISDEDVARQLIALGDASNFSSHGRTSTSTLDDALSGAADVASSTGATSDSDEQSEDDTASAMTSSQHPHSLMGAAKALKREASDIESDDVDDDYNNEDHEALTKGEIDDYAGVPKTKRIKTKSSGPAVSKAKAARGSSSSKVGKTGKARQSIPLKKQKASALGQMKAPPVPSSTPQAPRTSSSTLNFQQMLGVDEEDLSSKPRCQRCRKSKKGCDRQRPCQRCKDAGIGIEGCVSEDEGNGRKGRYGRHMGVSIKKDEGAPHDNIEPEAASAILTDMATSDSKKRKR